jgi:hypothetical protein
VVGDGDGELDSLGVLTADAHTVTLHNYVALDGHVLVGHDFRLFDLPPLVYHFFEAVEAVEHLHSQPHTNAGLGFSEFLFYVFG